MTPCLNIGRSPAQIVHARVGWKVPWIGVMSLMRPYDVFSVDEAYNKALKIE